MKQANGMANGMKMRAVVGIAIWMAVLSLSACKGGSSRAPVGAPDGPAESGEPRAAAAGAAPGTTAPGIEAEIVDAAEDPSLPAERSGLEGQRWQASGATIRLEAPIHPRAVDADPRTSRFVAWPARGGSAHIERAFFQVRVGQALSPRAPAQYDPVGDRWYVRLEDALGASLWDVSPERPVTFELDLVPRSGRAEKFKLELKLVPVLPTLAPADVDRGFGKVNVPTFASMLVREGAFLERKQLANPTSRALKLWVRLDDLGTLQLRGSHLSEPTGGGPSGSIGTSQGAFIADLIRVVRASRQDEVKARAGEWVGFELAPQESVVVELVAHLKDGTPVCPLFDANGTPRFDFKGALLEGQFWRSLRVTEEGEPASAANRGVVVEDRGSMYVESGAFLEGPKTIWCHGLFK